MGWEVNGCDDNDQCVHLNVSPFFSGHLFTGLSVSSVIGQNSVKCPETCKHRQMWGTEGKRIEGLLLSDSGSTSGRSYKLRRSSSNPRIPGMYYFIV